MTTALLVGCGGFFGSIVRFLLGSYIGRFSVGVVPYPTIIINLVGSFGAGILLAMIDFKTQPSYFYFLIPGFLGGFTTFSAFSAEAISLIQKDLYLPALMYIFLTLSGGLLFCALGILATKSVN